MSLKKILSVVVLIAAMMSAFAANGAEKGSINETRTLYVVVPEDPHNLDPNDSVAQPHFQITRQIFETLVVYDNDNNLLPWLAESWEYENDETIIFKIRKGVKFHNGDELKASDVLFTLKRMVDKKLTGYLEVSSILIDKCEIIDDYTLKMVTDGPLASQIAMLENPNCCIISERAYTESGGDFFNGGAMGTGPYTFVSYQAGDQVALKAFDNYWNQDAAPIIKNVVMRFVVDSSSRAIEAETGGADIVYDIGAHDMDRLIADPNVNLISDMGASTTYLCFNVTQAPLDNKLVREAIWNAIDHTVAVKVAFGNFGGIADDFVCPGVNGASKNIANYFVKRDVEKAKALLAQAGYPNGVTVTISVNNSSKERADMAEVLQAQCAEAGITLNIDIRELSAWAADLLAGKAQLSFYGLTATTFEAGRPLLHFLPNNAESTIWKYYEEGLMDKISTALATIDNEKRFQLYAECQEELMANFVALPVWFKGLTAACKTDIGGFRLTRSYEHHYLQYVYFIEK